MKRPGFFFVGLALLIATASFLSSREKPEGDSSRPAVSPNAPDAVAAKFDLRQPGLFREAGALTNAVADYDNDGDLDLFVGFNNKPNRLYRNDGGTFTDVASEVGVADAGATRACAWGDYNGDGWMDLFVGSVSADGGWDKLYRNDGGRHFTDVTAEAGVGASGSFRQVSWIDYDNDGDVDLFLGMRDKPNLLFRNDGGKFTDVAAALGVADPRRTVGAVWFDFDRDGDLDLYVANMDGDANGLFRNDGGRFTDVARELGVDSGGRPLGSADNGTVRPSLADYDNDGDIDIFCANYGPNALYRNLGGKKFENVAPEAGLAIDSFYDTAVWGDWDNDGWIDLYVNGTITHGKSYEDYLFHNDRGRFSNVTPGIIRTNDGDHGAQWFDFDRDGDLDLALTGAAAGGMHHLLRNLLPKNDARRSLDVLVLDENGHYTKAGAEVRLYASGTKRLLGTNILDTGSGYDSQNAMPVHFGLSAEGPVDVEVTVMTRAGRRDVRIPGVDFRSYPGRCLTVRVDRNGKLAK